MKSKAVRIAGLLLTASLAFAQPSGRSNPPRLIKVDDMHRFHDVRDLQISPDGKWVAYTLSSADKAADKRDTDVWMVSWDGARNLRITSSPENETAPRWSPDGRYLSFLSSRPGKARGNQVWLLERAGGEAQQLTDVKGRLTSYDWSPDSKTLLLVMTDRDPNDPANIPPGNTPPNTPDDERLANPMPVAKAPKPIVIDRYKFKQDVQGYLTQPAARLYLFD